MKELIKNIIEKSGLKKRFYQKSENDRKKKDILVELNIIIEKNRNLLNKNLVINNIPR